SGGVLQTIGAIGFNHVTDIDFNPVTGQLYGVVSDILGSGLTALISIDVNTGAGTLIGPTGAQIPDISFNSSGVLYAWSEAGAAFDDLGTINLTTGAFTTIGSPL